MELDRKFARRYSLNVARLKPGKHEEHFEVDNDFFAHFENSLVEAGQVHIRLEMEKYATHLDVAFNLEGEIDLPCDRCGNPYAHSLQSKERIIYAFNPSMDFEGYEVMYVAADEPQLVLAQEFYDFISISIPMRKVPPQEVHLCPPEVLALLGLDPEGQPLPGDQAEDDEIDPRWAALKKLKDQPE